MATSQTQPIRLVKQQRYRFWGRFALLLGLLLLLYYGYCWGWWGRSSLLMQYIFQCGCPVSSTETRYPEQIDVLIPACHYDEIMVSPNGRFLYVNNMVLRNDVSYFWNLQTNERFPFIIPKGSKYFLADDVLFLRLDYGKGLQGGEYILDRITGIQYPIQNLDSYFNNEVNIGALIETIQKAEDVYLIDDRWIVSIASDFRAFPERNFIVNSFDIPSQSNIGNLEEFLREHDIVYTYITKSLSKNKLVNSLCKQVKTRVKTRVFIQKCSSYFWTNPNPVYPEYYDNVLSSPDGDFVARNDGIYLTDSESKIVDGYFIKEPLVIFFSHREYFYLAGWTYDGSGAIYSHPSKPCLIRYWLPGMDGGGCLIKVSQPVLKLKVPQQYLPPVLP